MADIVLFADAAMVGAMQGAVDAVEFDMHACTVARFDHSTQVMQQRLHLAPVNIAAHRLLENGLQYALMFLAHGVKQSVRWVLSTAVFDTGDCS